MLLLYITATPVKATSSSVWKLAVAYDGMVRVWNDPLSPEAGGFDRDVADSGNVASLAFDPGGTLLATATTNGWVKLWKLDAEHEPGAPISFRAHDERAAGVTFSPDGTHQLRPGPGHRQGHSAKFYSANSCRTLPRQRRGDGGRQRPRGGILIDGLIGCDRSDQRHRRVQRTRVAWPARRLHCVPAYGGHHGAR